MALKGLALLGWITLLHLCAVYLFTHGFLLSRLSLSDVSTCSDPKNATCTLPATHSRAVVLIIDALRFDFLSADPPVPHSPYNHGVLSLPRELTAQYPLNSFIFNAYSDPPTTTLQRIKGITTGSLPTFVDMGSNFGASSIEEDSIVNQLRRNGKKIAFMGDNTWMSVFADQFADNLTFPYDSFNVEDLHTVDEGVIEHLFPLLQKKDDWHVIIGHFLGVDHVGHRVGPDHPTMKLKLKQMDDVLRRVVEEIDDDTLLVVLGDHGMDSKGDHGGDGLLETSSALWIYSKKRFFVKTPPGSEFASSLTYTTFPGSPSAHRSVQQVDLVPTLSLLLGLPIPFNSLGSVIPDVFRDDNTRKEAMRLNAAQVSSYLQAYRSSPSGSELDEVWDKLSTLSRRGDPYVYTRAVLESCRALWAQFNQPLMLFGLVLMGASVLATYSLYGSLAEPQEDWEQWASDVLMNAARGGAGGSIAGFSLHPLLASHLEGITTLDFIIFTAPLLSAVVVTATTMRRPALSLSLSVLPVPLILHTLIFGSNSFTMWEDRIVLYLLISTLLPAIRMGFAAPTPRLRKRILGFAALFATAVRLMSFSTICREEQHPYCHVTFYASSTVPSPPILIVGLSIPLSFFLPTIIHYFLAITRSDNALAVSYLPLILRPSLLAGSSWWILEYLESSAWLEDEWSPVLRLAKTILARCAVGALCIAGGSLWFTAPSCLDISVTSGNAKIMGFANTFGGPYLMFWTIPFGVTFIVSQLTSQAVLVLGTIALLAHLEITDAIRDVKALQFAFASGHITSSTLDSLPSITGDSVPLAFTTDLAPLALLAIHAFHATGHQSVISTIQWKSAFVLTPTLTYPFSPALVALNTFGPHALFAGLAAPLVALWNVAPLPQPTTSDRVRRNAVRAGMGVMLYMGTLLLGSAGAAALLRRHLMVWKVFAPRFMSAAAGLFAVDLGVLLGVGVGVQHGVKWMARLFTRIQTQTERASSDQKIDPSKAVQ